MKESKVLEFKSQITNSFLKTVSAFSNFGTGEIIFGVNDDGTVCGLENPEKLCFDIENMINDSITPKPDYALRVNLSDKTVVLTVSEGKYKPYLYRGKAYRRSDTATIETDQPELKRLILEGSNLYFEGLPCHEDNLTFSYFETKLKDILGISELTDDMLRTFGFYTDTRELNNAAALFSDCNSFYGIDMVRFGNTISIILDRETYQNCSVFEQYDKAVNLYCKYYQHEEIKGIERNKVEILPETAFREAVANALVHRMWDINSHVRIAMHPDRIEIVSPGGLPKNVSKEEYLNGNISNLRNPIIGNIFFRLHYIEMFGTGIARIKEAYNGNPIQPEFDVSDNSIKITLPIISPIYEATTEEKKIIDLLSSGAVLSAGEIGEALGFGKAKVVRLLNSLIEKKYVAVVGNGRGTKYSLSRPV